MKIFKLNFRANRKEESKRGKVYSLGKENQGGSDNISGLKLVENLELHNNHG